MKIDGLTTCVGERYADYLAQSLPIWADTLDSVTIVTDDFLGVSINALNVGLVITDIFTRYGASFNKGAALSHGFAMIKEPEWILNFDADILPPPDWRKQIEVELTPGILFGSSRRFRADGGLIPDSPFPDLWGFFHLWHLDDPHNWIRPCYPVDCGHAGNYDHTFLRRWPEECRFDISPKVKLIHQGEPRTQWFGRDPKNHKKMFNLFMLGLWEAWHTRAGHVKVPEPEAETVLDSSNLTLEEIRWLLKKYTDPDPFRYRLEINVAKNRQERAASGD